MKPKKLTLAEIEQFIADAGSDSLAVFGGAYEGGIHVQQVPDELAPCILAILGSGETVKSFLEIGAAAGGTTFIFNHFFKPEKIVLVDDNNHWKHSLRAGILKDVERQEIIGNSHVILPDMLISRTDNCFDLIIIDGDHSHEGVKADVENCLPMLRKGGFLILHDTATRQWGCDVPLMLEEMKLRDDVSLVGEYVSPTPPVCGLALFRKVSE